jgi:endonuclease YncB( thermonuclease family)
MKMTEGAIIMNHHYKETEKPALTPIKNGWAAHGDGWAVHGSTPKEAVEKFFEAKQRHRKIDKLPFWYERFNAQSPKGARHE